nr:MAG TPA: Cytosine specific methyltransferase [Caudoviricetes sp.]
MESNTTLALGSLFDGSGGFPLGGLLCGITPVWASEIEPFPIRVTTKRLPFMKHYGDISQMDGGKIEPVDIITFGSPCTDMSIAGRRAGLDGKQSVLFYQAIRIIQEMRDATHGKYPRYIVWENVPGALSSNHGEDFKAVLEAVIGIKEPGTQVPMPEKNLWPYADLYLGEQWSVAYRTLDAQHWGVPQRRRRIFLVADFAGWGAGQVLFESEGLSGYSAEGFRAWQRAAGNSAVGAGAAGICLNDQGGSCMDVTENVVATLRAENHGHPPCVMDAAGFCTEHSADSRGIGFEQERAPTLRAGVVPAAIALESHPIDSRIKIADDGTIQTLTSRMGTGGMNVPLVMKIRSGCEGGGKGPLIQEDKSATLGCNNDQTVFVPFVKGTRPHTPDEGQQWKPSDVANTLNTYDVGETRCNELAVKVYGICSKQSHAMLSDNPHSGFYEADTSRSLDANGGNPTCNQGGMAVVAVQGSMIGRSGKNGPQGSGINEDVSFTLDAADRHAVAYCMTSGSYTQTLEEQSPTLMARDYKDPPVVNETEPEYIVRRLTPTECARLQGFPDWWCAGLAIDNPSEEEIEFWTEVFETHRKIMGTSSKPKSHNQIIKWLKDPHSDSAEYKMWGNGVALPNVYFVLSGIVWALKNEETA